MGPLSGKVAVVSGQAGVAGWMRTEAMLENFRQRLRRPEEIAQTDSVEFGGRAVLALATDPNILEKTGKTLRVYDLAQEYGFEDVER